MELFRSFFEDVLSIVMPIIGTLVIVAVIVMTFQIPRLKAKENTAFNSAMVILETKLGVEAKYEGHQIVYVGLSHSYSQYDDINLLVDGKLLTLSPRASLDEVGVGWKPRYAFFLPEGRKLILKEVSEDRSILKWTDVDWSQN